MIGGYSYVFEMIGGYSYVFEMIGGTSRIIWPNSPINVFGTATHLKMIEKPPLIQGSDTGNRIQIRQSFTND